MSNVIIAVSKLEGEALNYAVAMAIHGFEPSSKHAFSWRFQNSEPRKYSTNPDLGGRLLHQRAVWLKPSDPYAEFGGTWTATCITSRESAAHTYYHEEGDTPLIAGMRAIVGAILGDTVSIPTELLEQSA